MQLMIISWFITLIAKTRNDGSGIVAIANALLAPLFIVKTVILSYRFCLWNGYSAMQGRYRLQYKYARYAVSMPRTDH